MAFGTSVGFGTSANVQSQISSAVAGLYDDRGNYDASGNTFPASGGSGSAGAILKGDVWMISVAGTLDTEPVESGDTVRALVDTPGQTAGNWAIIHNTAEQEIPYDIAFEYSGLPEAGELRQHIAARPFTLSASGQQAEALAGATAEADFLVKVNGVLKATLRFAAAGVSASIVGGTQTSVAAGDVVSVTAPASQDATLADIAITLKGAQA